MSGIVKVNEVRIVDNRVDYFLDVSGEITKFFNLKTNMFVEYNCNIKNVPYGIAIIPLLTNILPVIWFSDSEVIVEELDKTFYNSLENIKQGFMKTYPDAILKGKVKVNKIIDYKYEAEEEYATFFSGGVDSLATLINNIDKSPTLVTIWGADINLNDEEGWKNVEKDVTDFGKRMNLDNLLIKSSFTMFINKGELTKAYKNIIENDWWGAVQHGIGLIGLPIPYAYKNKIKRMYIPGTYCNKDSQCKWGSNPFIDNKVKFSKCDVLHEGFEYNRQEKINIIARYLKNNKTDLFIRVCWKSKGGINCNKCEKCSRTIMGLIAAGINPNNYGFKVSNETIDDIKINFKSEWILHNDVIDHWNRIQDRFENNKYCRDFNNLDWIFNIDFNKQNELNKLALEERVRKSNTFSIRIKTKIYSILKKLKFVG